MERVNINKIISNQKKIIHVKNIFENYGKPISYVYELKDNTIVKVFEKEFISILKIQGADIEKKVLSKERILFNDNIILPEKIIYDDNNEFAGYTMKKVSGPNYNEYIDSLRYRDLSDLTKYILVHSKLEEIMMKNKNVVFPDFCSCDNIYLNRNLDLYLIDYDGMQIDNLAAVCTSTSVGSYETINNSKYINNALFTKELDKRSSIILFFLTVFNINLNLIGSIIPETGNIITLEEVLNNIGINDYELYDKVRRIFDHEVQNEFLGETLQKMEKDYKLEIITNCYIQGQKRYFKKLVKK